MGRLRKCFGKGIPVDCSEEADASDGVPFVPNDFAEDDDYPFSEDGEMDDAEFDKALYDLYVSHKVNRLKRKLSCAAARNVKFKRSSDFPTASTFTRYSGKLFSSCIAGLSPRQVHVIQSYGADCLLKFVRTEVPLRFVKWLASKFDVHASEIQVRKRFIPVTKHVIHDILDLPVDGEPIFSDAEAGREFILSHFNVTSIPPVSFFANKLKSTTEELSDEDIFICFMCVAFSTFLCPNSSLSPSPKYLHIFRDCSSVMNYDLSRFVYECLLTSIKKFKDSTKVASKRTVTFGGCHYALAVSYLDNVHFGLNSLPDTKPRILIWRGNKVKHFSELDKCNSPSYGKRPLKHLSPSLYAPKSCEKFSCSRGHDAATSNIPFANNISTSEVNARGGSNVPFACKVEASYASRLGNEVVKQIIDLVQKSNAVKPQIFQDWSELLVFNVLGFIGDSSFKSSVRSHAESPLDNKADSPTFKISSSDNLSGCKSVTIESSKKASDDPSVTKTAENVLSDEFTKAGLNIPPPGIIPVLGTAPVAASSPITAPGIVPTAPGPITAPVAASCVVTAPGIVPTAPSPVSASDVHPVVSHSPKDFSKGSSPSTSLLAMPVAMPTSIPSGSPLKRCKPNVDVISHERPSMSRFKTACEPKVACSVTKADQFIGSAGVDFEFHPAAKNHSPLLPVDKVQCSQYVSERILNCPESPFEQQVQSSNSNHVDIGSPEGLNEFFNGGDDVVGIDEVQIVGTSTFSDRCVNFTKKTNEAYNQLNNLASSSSFTLGVSKSPEVLIISDPGRVAKLKAAHHRNLSTISKVSDCSTATTQHIPRRIVGAARFNSDPYVQQLNRFPVTLQERKYYFAINRIGSDDVLCKYEAIRYDRAFCSYRSLASICPNGHIDNFLILCFCRFLFNKCHPSKSKKHFFFSYVGECILNNNNPNTRNPSIVRNAFEGACSAYLLWRSNFLYFPIGLDKH